MRKGMFLTAAAMMLLVAGDASAQFGTKNFFNYCTTGAIRTCASAQVSTFDAGGGATRVEIRIRNLQGTNATDNTGGSLITSVGLTSPSISNATALSPFVTTEGTAVAKTGTGGGQHLAPGAYWSITNNPIQGQVAFSAHNNQGTRGGILGCNEAGPSNQSRFETCGNGGWVVFSFTTSNYVNFQQVEFAYGMQSAANGGGSYQCRSADPSCVPPPTTTTPEPVSMVLMGSGLAGLAAVRRRRRESGLVSDVDSEEDR
jgi:hypothetical protein